jgi:hypothetical protein
MSSNVLTTLRLLVWLMATAVLLNAQQVGGSGSKGELLYVLDTDHQDLDRKAQVLVVDPQRKAVIKSYRAGYHPDLVLSQDGKRLYLSYDVIQPDAMTIGQLDVIDTVAGKTVASVSNPDRLYDTLDDLVHSMAFSADGGLLYVARVKDLGDAEVAYGIAVFDTQTNKFLPDLISLPLCVNGILMPSDGGRTLSVVCRGSEDVRVIQFDQKGVPLTRIPTSIPLPRHGNQNVEIATSFFSDSNDLTVVYSDGSYFQVSLQTRKFLQQGVMALSPPLKAGSTFFGPYITPVWDGKVFLVVTESELYRGSGLASAVVVLNVKTLAQESFIKPGALFSNLAVGDDGSVFLVEPSSSIIDLLATPNGVGASKISGIGISPTLIVVSH